MSFAFGELKFGSPTDLSLQASLENFLFQFHLGLPGLGMPEISYTKVSTILKASFVNLTCSDQPGGFCYAKSIFCNETLATINDYRFDLIFGFTPDQQFQIPIYSLMRETFYANGTFKQCEFLINNLGSQSIGQADYYVIGDFFFQLFFAQFSFVNPFQPGLQSIQPATVLLVI